MSQMTFAVLDAERAIHAHRHASFVDVLVGAPGDDPETIEELDHAMRRFLPPDDDNDRLSDWAGGEDDQPFDAGICLIDLPGQLIVYQSTQSEFQRSGEVTYDMVDEAERARRIRYNISRDWHITEQLDGWRAESNERRRTQLANPPLDTRAVLYERVAEIIVDECLAARGGHADADGRWTPPDGGQWREQDGGQRWID
jgi:hypothetical protein